MDDNFVNELFTRIEVLEAEKAAKDAQVATLVEQVTKLESENSDLRSQNDNLRALIKQKVGSTDSLNQELDHIQHIELRRSETSIDERFRIVEIVFKPESTIDENDTVSILGEFTNWIPEIMERYESERVLLEPALTNTFFYRTKLFVGYKYRYHFSVGEQFVVDSSKEVSEDRFGKMTNFVEVHPKNIAQRQPKAPESEERKAEGAAATVSVQLAVVEEQKADEGLDAVIDSMEEESKGETQNMASKPGQAPAAQSLLLNSFPSYVNTEMDKYLPKDILKKQGVRIIDQSAGSLCDLLKMHASTADEIADLKALIQEATSSGSFGQLGLLQQQVEIKVKSVQDLVQKIRVRVKCRLVRPIHSQQTIYEISDYDEQLGQVKLRLLFDPSGILIKKDNMWEKVRRSIRGTWLDKHYLILPQDEELDVRQRILSKQDCKLKVKYQVMDIDGEAQCLTQQILPEGLRMQDYELKFNQSQRYIYEVTNREYGPVEFEAQLLDKESSYVLGSKIDVYTTLLQQAFGNDTAEILNIIHVHLSDMSDFTSLDVVYLKKGETRQDHMEFKEDEMGVMLRYKVLVKNLAIFEILYNTGSSVEVIPFQEIRLEQGGKYLINGVDDLSAQPMFATIQSIPVQMLACPEQYRAFADTLDASQAQYFMFGQCHRRCFERLPGYIDINLLSMDGLQTISEEPMQVAIPACKCSEPDQMSLMLYESHLQFQKDSKKSELVTAFEAYEQVVKKMDSTEERKAIEKDLDSMQEYFSSLQKTEQALESALSSSEQGAESAEQQEQRQQLMEKANQIKRRMAVSIRMEQRKKAAAQPQSQAAQ